MKTAKTKLPKFESVETAWDYLSCHPALWKLLWLHAKERADLATLAAAARLSELEFDLVVQAATQYAR